MSSTFRRCGATGLAVAALFVMLLLLPASAGSQRPVAGGFVASTSRHFPAARALAAAGTGSPSQLGVPTAIIGWAELYNGCFLDAGSWQVTSPPSHGTLSFSTFYGATDACGNSIPYNEMYYTWTDATTTATSDTFSATWSSSDGRFIEPGTWTVGNAAPFKQACSCPGPCPCSCACSSDPVVLSTGGLMENFTDYTTSGPNRLSFRRYYNNPVFGAGLPLTLAKTLGPEWRTNYDRYLRITSVDGRPAAIAAEREDGTLLSFGRDGGKWVGDSDIDAQLVETGGGKWTLIDTDDTVETYAAIGAKEALLTSIEKRGYMQTLAYNSAHQLVAVVDSYGRRLDFAYKNGLLETVKTPDGLVVGFGYKSIGNGASAVPVLASVTYSTKPTETVSYQYGDTTFPFALTGLVDEDGSLFESWAYDSNGRVVSNQEAGGANLTSFTYNSDGSTTVTNALGQQQVYDFAVLQGAPKVIEIDRLATATTAAASELFTYDRNGYRTSATDWNGNRTTYVNDPQGLPTTITEAAGTAQRRITQIAWDTNFREPLRIAAPLLTTTFAYDANGDPLRKTETGSGHSRGWAFAWTEALPAAATDPRGDRSSFTWDGGALVSVTNALGQATRITEHLPGGLPERIVDPNGVETRLAYDARDRLLSSAVATASGMLTTSYGYDPVGNLIKVTWPDGSALTAAYDEAHRLIAITDLFDDEINYTLDALGDRTQTTWSAGSTIARQQAGVFDALGRMLQDIGGVGQTTTYGYDANGNRVSITDPLGHVTTQAFDALNRVVRITDAAGGVIALKYNPQNHPIRVADPDGHSTAYAWDGFGDMTGMVSPDTGDTTFDYDLDGNLVARDRLGLGEKADVVTDWTYDRLNRVTERSYPGDRAEDVVYSYDRHGAGFGIGRLTGMTDGGGKVAFAYDARGNLLSQARTAGKAVLATLYAYDKASRIVGVTYPSRAVADYRRDAMGRIIGVSLTPPGATDRRPLVSGVAYEPFGPPNALTYGNGIAEKWTFDLDWRPLTLAESGNTPRTLGYSYDADDNVLKIADTTPGGNQSFAYDVLDRLTSAGGFFGSLRNRYDPVGNLLSQTAKGVESTFAYAAGSNRLASISSGGKVVRQFGYTPFGNIAADEQPAGTLTLAYNDDDRLASVTTKAGAWDYVYDGFEERLAKRQRGGLATAYQYDQAGRLIEEDKLSATVSAPQVDYVYLGNRPIAMRRNGSLWFLEGDRLGTPQIARDASQALGWQALYAPFGQVRLRASDVTQNLRLPGQYFDAESGYYHNGWRDYDPSLGRYLESDPIGLRGGLNTYLYALASPTGWIDGAGLCPGADSPRQITPDEIGWPKSADYIPDEPVPPDFPPLPPDYPHEIGWPKSADYIPDEPVPPDFPPLPPDPPVFSPLPPDPPVFSPLPPDPPVFSPLPPDPPVFSPLPPDPPVFSPLPPDPPVFSPLPPDPPVFSPLPPD
jgi:RHS repeat-associated protein